MFCSMSYDIKQTHFYGRKPSVHIFVDIPSSSNDMSSVGEPTLFRGAGAVKKIQGAGNGAVNLFRGSREPEPVKTPKNDFQESSGSRAFLEGFGAGFFYIKNGSQEPGLF